MKKVLFVATIIEFMGFEKSDMQILSEMGYEIHCATNFRGKEERTKDIPIIWHQIDFERSPLSKRNIKAFGQLRRLLREEDFTLVHCHTPVGGVLARLAAKKYRRKGLKVIYTAHGFHFFKGAPQINWILYFPVEWILSWYTDVLITINREDYLCAEKHMHSKKIEYIPGVGVDIDKFNSVCVNKEEKCKELGIPSDKFILLSAGELSERKNQRVVIEALHKINNKEIYYLIAGGGNLYDEFVAVIKRYGMEDNIKLLGFRADIDELCEIADCFVHPSVREGLGMAPLEAMASGLPLISAYVNGMRDYTENGKSGCCISPNSVEEMVKAIEKMYTDKEFREKCGTNNIETVRAFSLENSRKIREQIYTDDFQYAGGVKHLENLLCRIEKRDELGIPQDVTMLLSVGELSRRKNHKVVIEALRQLNNRNIKYYICGDGELRNYLIQLIDKTELDDGVFLLGFRNDVKDILYAADLFILPSLQEGVSVALMEAMSVGLPVVCSDIRGNRDLIVDEFFLFDPQSSDTLKDCLKRVLSARRSTGTELPEEFRGSEIRKRMMAIYDNCLRK